MKYMSTQKRGDNWYINFRFNRTRYRLKSPDNSMSGAKMYESMLRQKLARGESLETPQEEIKIIPAFAEFSKEWMTSYVENNNKWSEIQNKRTILKVNLLPFFGNFRLDQISNRDIEEYKALKIKSGLNPKSINNHLSCLRKCLNTASEWNIITNVPKIKLLKVPPPQTFFITPEECDMLLQTAEGNWHDMILTVLRTGLRFGELIALKWSDIDFNRKILTVQRSIVRGKIGSTKSNKNRIIPLAYDLSELLSSKTRTSEYIFTNENGQILKQNYCLKKISALAKLAGIRKIGWHALRHTFASHLANNGVIIQAVQQLLGHSDLKTTMRYAHLAPETLVDAIAVLQIHSSKVWTQDGHKNTRTEILRSISAPQLNKINA